MARDLDRVRAVSVADVPSLSIKLDEAVRLVDELPLLVNPERKPAPAAGPAHAAAAPSREAQAASAAGFSGWLGWVDQAWQRSASEVWAEVRSLVRVTRIDQPEAMLVAPEQAYFLRENMKLKLLNVRLSLLARQNEAARADTAAAVTALYKYFDPSSRRTQAAAGQLQQVQAQVRVAEVPRMDETLAALATAAAGR